MHAEKSGPAVVILLLNGAYKQLSGYSHQSAHFCLVKLFQCSYNYVSLGTTFLLIPFLSETAVNSPKR